MQQGVYTQAYRHAGLGQQAGGPFCPDGPSYPTFPYIDKKYPYKDTPI